MVGKSAVQSEDVTQRTISSEVCDSSCQEKPLLCDTCPYRKPTQVDEERILRPAGSIVKELGKMTPLGEGCQRDLAAENRLKQLFSKNTGLCKTER